MQQHSFTAGVACIVIGFAAHWLITVAGIALLFIHMYQEGYEAYLNLNHGKYSDRYRA
jgi:hypothetical protein